MIGNVLSNNMKFVKGNSTLAQQLLAAVDHPANGSYIDVAGYSRVHIIALLGVIHNSDEVTLTPKVSDAVDGTLDVLDTDLAHTIDAADDEEIVTWTLEVEDFPTDHHFVGVDVSGTTSNGSYGVILFLLEGYEVPVTQTTAVLPTASQYWRGGGVSQAD